MARRGCADPPAQREYEHVPERDLVQQQHPIQPRRVIGQPHRGGYDCEFVERPSEAAIQCECPICLLVLREPHQIACCGYSYCEACIKRVQKYNNSCPSCNTNEFTTFPDKRLKRSLYAFRVYCSHRGAGCEWVGELLDLERHLNLQPPPEKLLLGCQFSEVHCTYCVHSFQRRYIQSHQIDDCLQRPFACEHCNDYKSTYEVVTETHYKMCAYFPLSCPEHCGKYFPRHEIPGHVSRDCPLTIVLCDFHIVGCKVEIARIDLPTHINDSLAGHMSLLQAHAMAYPRENIATLLPLFLGSFQKLILDNVGIQSQLGMAESELRKSHESIATQADMIASLRERFGKFESMCESKIKEHFVRNMAMTEEKHSTAIAKFQEEIAQSRKTVATQADTIASLQEGFGKLENMCESKINDVKQHSIRKMAMTEEKHSTAVAKFRKEIAQSLSLQQQTLTERLKINAKELASLRQCLTEHKREFDASQKKAIDDVSKEAIANTARVERAFGDGVKKCREELKTDIEAHRIQTKALEQRLSKYVKEIQDKLKSLQNDITRQMKANEHKHAARISTQEAPNASLKQSVSTGKLESEAKIKTVKDELTNKITTSETKLQDMLATQQVVITEHKEISRKALSEQKEEFDLERSMFRHELVSKLEQQERQLIMHRDILQPMASLSDFTFTDFEKHKNEDDVWYSPPFYTHSCGYRMCIRVDANGDGDGKGTHVSVFSYLMRGDFDDRLPWPCREAVTIQLLNQVQDRNHHTCTITFSETTDPKYISRVKSGKRAGSGWGNSTLISTDKLHLDTSGKCQYLKDDQLKFKVYRTEVYAMTSREHLSVMRFENLITPRVYTRETPVEFTLSDYEQRKNEGAEWHSPAYYTHSGGYRICLKVHPNGIRDGSGTHVSVYTCIMQGPFDAQLKWPFQAKITIRIVNQAGDDNHHERTINFNDKIPEKYAGRVMDKEKALGWGHGQFIPHTSLRHTTASNTEYLRNDSLVIRVKIQLQ